VKPEVGQVWRRGNKTRRIIDVNDRYVSAHESVKWSKPRKLNNGADEWTVIPTRSQWAKWAAKAERVK
jgi:hypothetical protein